MFGEEKTTKNNDAALQTVSVSGPRMSRIDTDNVAHVGVQHERVQTKGRETNAARPVEAGRSKTLNLNKHHSVLIIL